MNPAPWQEELQELCEAALEDRLSAEQLARLEQLVLEEPEARRFYVEYLHQHGCLHWSAAQPEPVSVPLSSSRGMPSPPRPDRALRRIGFLAAGLIAASLLIMIVVGMNRRTSTGPAALATLASSKGCKWDGGTLPTEDGARLGTGRLRLDEGIARITFDNGVAVTIEAPADLELVSSQRCVLRGGRLVAKVPHNAIGFMVDTPTAILTDLGTEFGVNVRNGQAADVQVFDGVVDVRHRSSGKTERLKTGTNRRFETQKVDDFNPLEETPTVEAVKPLQQGTRLVRLTTAMGKGKDAYIQRLYPSEHFSDILLLVKNATNEDYSRKAYIGIDLTPVKGREILEAELSVTFAPTGMGFASEVGDCTFVVYGLIDEALDAWNERTMRWRDAPANRPGPNLDPAKVVRLGTFQMAQGVQRGTRSISGPAVVDFLRRDNNGLATFIVVRETLGSGRFDLVHGFAGKNHPSLPPPTLTLTVGKAAAAAAPAKGTTTISDARKDADGFLTHTVASPFQKRETDMRVLLPDRLEKDRRYPVVYVLPVEAGRDSKYGDGLREIRKLDLANKQNVIVVAPSFAALPWYVDHPSDPTLRQESYFRDVVLPFIEKTYPALGERRGRLLLGFSKSGWGAFSLLLRHPDTFERAAAWDAPLTMTRPQFGMQEIVGTQEQFEKYRLTKVVEQQAQALGKDRRLALIGVANFQKQHEEFHALLARLEVPHEYVETKMPKHTWDAGWLPEAMQFLTK